MHVTRNLKYQRRLKEAEEIREHFLREYHIANITRHAAKTVAASMFWLERRYPNEFALKSVNRDSGGELEQAALCDKISLEQLIENARLAAAIAANPPPGLRERVPGVAEPCPGTVPSRSPKRARKGNSNAGEGKSGQGCLPRSDSERRYDKIRLRAILKNQRAEPEISN